MASAQGFGLSVDEAAEDAMRGQALSAILRGQSRITRALGLASQSSRSPLVASGIHIRNHELVGESDAAERALLSCEVTDGPPTADIARASLKNGWVCVAASRAEARQVCDRVAPEHLALQSGTRRN